MARPRRKRPQKRTLTRADVWLCTPGFEADLTAELGRASSPGAGFVTSAPRGAQVGDKVRDAVFARQVLPDARVVSGEGPTDLCDAALAALDDDERQLVLSGRAALEVFPPDFERAGSARPAPHPLAAPSEEVADLLAKKVAGKARKRAVDQADAVDHVLQVLLTDAWRGWVSLAERADDPLLAWPARFPGGRAPVRGYEDAPSSAYRKLVEALAWLGAAPGAGDVALDLGAAPGGWTYVLLGLGADVIAVDRAQLSDRVSGHAGLTHLKKDAFAHAPIEDATWLCCDVIDEPARLLDVARRAAASEKLRGLVLTVKLKRPVSKEALDDARAIVRDAPGFFGRVKHLVHNKNEVTLLLRRR
jgi:23S rRNA (cytidine2498-2'-O)-methyltransferase